MNIFGLKKHNWKLVWYEQAHWIDEDGEITDYVHYKIYRSSKNGQYKLSCKGRRAKKHKYYHNVVYPKLMELVLNDHNICGNKQ